MDRNDQDHTRTSDLSHPPPPRFVRGRPRKVLALSRLRVAVIVFLIPLVTAISLGAATWFGSPPWVALLLAGPGVLVVVISAMLDLRERRVFMGIVLGASMVVSAVLFVVVLGESLTRFSAPLFIVFACTVSALLGILFSSWLTWKQGRRRRRR